MLKKFWMNIMIKNLKKEWIKYRYKYLTKNFTDRKKRSLKEY